MSDLLERFSKACGEPIASVDSWVDGERAHVKIRSAAGVEHTVSADEGVTMGEAMGAHAEWFNDRRQNSGGA